MSRCNSCHQPIQWARSSAGRSIPFDLEPVDGDTKGAMALLGSRAFNRDEAITLVSQREAVSMVRARQILDEAGDWHISHFATCPNADQHRRAKPAAASKPPADSALERPTLL